MVWLQAILEVAWFQASMRVVWWFQVMRGVTCFQASMVAVLFQASMGMVWFQARRLPLSATVVGELAQVPYYPQTRPSSDAVSYTHLTLPTILLV